MSMNELTHQWKSEAAHFRSNMRGQEITQPVQWPLFCHHWANAMEQSAWTASPDVTFGQFKPATIDIRRLCIKCYINSAVCFAFALLKTLCLVNWAAAPRFSTLRLPTKNLLTYLLNYFRDKT